MTDQFTEARGRQLAVAMMIELGEQWGYGLDDVPDEQLTEAMISQDPAVMRRYLDTVKRAGNVALERGFLCVLSDYLAGSMSSSIDLERYTGRRHRGA